jgi:hypothetical protein
MDAPPMTYATMMTALKRRLDFLQGRIAEAEAIGRRLTWASSEALALAEAIRRLQEQERKRIAKDPS